MVQAEVHAAATAHAAQLMQARPGWRVSTLGLEIERKFGRAFGGALFGDECDQIAAGLIYAPQPQVQPAPRDPAVIRAELAQARVGFDSAYDYSDDPRVYSAGHAQWQTISRLQAELRRAEQC